MSYEQELVNPLAKASSKQLESVAFDADFGGYVVTREQAVPHQSVRPLGAWEQANVLNKVNKDYPGTLIEAGVRNERNSTESRLQGKFYPKNSGTKVWPSKLYRTVEREELARFADSSSMRQEYVVREATLPALSNLTLSVQQDLYAPDLDRRRTTVADAFQTRENVETDPDTGLMTRIVSEVVFALPTLSEQLAGRNVSYKEVATGIWIKETRTALKSDGTEVNPASNAAFYTSTWITREPYQFPGYMYLVETTGPNSAFRLTFLPSQRRTQVVFNPPVRFPWTALAEVEYTETWHAAQPAWPNNHRNFTGKTWVHDGTLVNINIKNILMDTSVIMIATNPADSFHGYLTETIYTYETTPISAVEYRNSYLGTWQLVDVSITRGPNKTFRMLQKRVKMQGNLTPGDADVGGFTL